MENNNENDLKIRRYKNQLMMSGFGCILLGGWSAIRMILSVYLEKDKILDALRNAADRSIYESVDAKTADTVLFFTYLGMTVFILIISFLIHFYVGRCAVREGRDGRKRNFYLVIAGLFLLSIVISYIGIGDKNIADSAEEAISKNADVVTYVLDASMAFTFLDMLFSAVLSRIYLKKNGGGE